MSGASKACQQLLLTPRFVGQYQGERETSVSAKRRVGLQWAGVKEMKTRSHCCARSTGASASAVTNTRAFEGPAPPPSWCELHYISFAFDLDTLEEAHVSATHSSSGKHRACSGAYGERQQCGVWRWQVCLPAACHHVIQAIGGRDDHVGKLPCKALVLSRRSHAPHGGCCP